MDACPGPSGVAFGSPPAPPCGTAPGLAVRLLSDGVGDGPTNMALDEALLATATAEGVASLRFYGWSAPTLSLGYFQASAPALAMFPGLPWVRRATGGAALVHHHELTYALALPAGRGWQPPGASWVCTMHHAIRRALATFGIASALCTEERKLGEVLCFRHHTPGDLLIGDDQGGAGGESKAPRDKVAGSAQRKSHGAVLQHGGILLTRSPSAPQLPGINDLTGRGLAHAALLDAVRAAFAEMTGWVLAPADFTAAELEAAERIKAERYLSEGWNGRR